MMIKIKIINLLKTKVIKTTKEKLRYWILILTNRIKSIIISFKRKKLYCNKFLACLHEEYSI